MPGLVFGGIAGRSSEHYGAGVLGLSYLAQAVTCYPLCLENGQEPEADFSLCLPAGHEYHGHAPLQGAGKVNPWSSCLGSGTSRVGEVGLLVGAVLWAWPMLTPGWPVA